MCVAYEINCSCGNGMAGFNFKDEIMTGDVINRLYCPQCSKDIKFNPETMIADNDWIIEYNMDIARFHAPKIKTGGLNITPEFIFDEGYCTWRGIYRTDHIDNTVERAEVVKLAKTNPKGYLEEIKDGANNRMTRLSKGGLADEEEI